MSDELQKLILDLRGDILSLRREIQDLRSQGAGVDTSAVGDADAGGAQMLVDRGSDVDQEN